MDPGFGCWLLLTVLPQPMRQTFSLFSDSLADLMVRAGVTRQRPVVLGSGGSKGVDLSTFYPSPAHIYDPKTPRLGFLGRLTSDKGLGDALAVLDSIRVRYPGARMEVIGALDAASPETPAVVRRLESDPSIAWLQHIPARMVADHMRTWDLLVFPSLREGLPNAVVEAAACGVPTVGYRTTGVVDAVGEGISGMLVRKGDRAALTAAALECLGTRRRVSLKRWGSPLVCRKVRLP